LKARATSERVPALVADLRRLAERLGDPLRPFRIAVPAASDQAQVGQADRTSA
jgi:hypothetical protein